MKALDASYGPFRALFTIDFTLVQGETTALLGPNGAGKTTLARVISGLVPVTAGSLWINGKEANAWPMWKRRRAGVLHIPEGRGVFSTLSVEENLKIALVVHPRSDRSELLAETFARYPLLRDRRRMKAGALSGGQQQLLSLAPAIVTPPLVLIVDEPSQGLDPSSVEEVYESMSSLKEAGVTMLIIEQQINRILTFADRAVVLDHGSVSFTGNPSDATAALEAGLSGDS
jgi:branched-chain amino acid transport system ATP-binding protein